MFKTDLSDVRELYVDRVSGGNYPITLELAQYLYDLCWKIKPKRILDRGSGYSSFVFRKYALMSNRRPAWCSIDEEKALDIYTVDSDSRWLEKSQEFVRDCGLHTGDFYTWEDFVAKKYNEKKFDLILEDYHFPTRCKTLHVTLDMLAKGGYLVLDDTNLVRLQNGLNKVSKRYLIAVGLIKESKCGDQYASLIRWK